MAGALADLSAAHLVFTDEAALDDFVAQDPYVNGGVVAAHSKSEWSIVS